MSEKRFSREPEVQLELELELEVTVTVIRSCLPVFISIYYYLTRNFKFST